MAQYPPDRSDPLSRFHQLAETSVARACAFAGLATICLMVGMANDAANSLKAGGYCALLACVILLIKAHMALKRPVKRTELWIMLEKSERPPEIIAQPMLGGILQMTYLRFASLHARAACALLSLALLLRLFGIEISA
jgi:hypothetical protein